MLALVARLLDGAFLRFLLVGMVNTSMTYVLFVFLALFLHHLIAYSIAYMVGILLAYFLSGSYVFRAGLSFRSFVKFPGVYVVHYSYGVAALTVLVGYLGVDANLAVAVAIVSGIPITFFLSRLVFRHERYFKAG